MPISPARFVPHEAKNIVIKIYSYKDQNISGALSNIQMEKNLSFANLTQMLFGIEKIMDATQFPQPNFDARSFPLPIAAPKQDFPLDEDPKKPLASFKLNVLFRQNASWQGNLIWLDENSEVQFRSALELVQLLDSVLDRL